jgi:hypothetical protein
VHPAPLKAGVRVDLPGKSAEPPPSQNHVHRELVRAVTHLLVHLQNVFLPITNALAKEHLGVP